MIDATDWGHRVGEIEIVVPDREQVIQATQKIEDLGRELGKSFSIFLKKSVFFCFLL